MRSLKSNLDVVTEFTKIDGFITISFLFEFFDFPRLIFSSLLLVSVCKSRVIAGLIFQTLKQSQILYFYPVVSLLITLSLITVVIRN